MILNVEKAIIKTLIYADIFDYPLTEKEIWHSLIKFKTQPLSWRDGTDFKIEIETENYKKNIQNKHGFYFLKGREGIIKLRQKRANWSGEKFKIAQRLTFFLKFIPTVKLIGITGALAMNNAKQADDIDLFIISSARRLWLTRFIVTLLLEITGKRRCPEDCDVNNKICLNMFIDEDHLEIPRKEQDLFTAHEVLQMKPLWYRDNIYSIFLRSNSWVKRYLPNSIRHTKYSPPPPRSGTNTKNKTKKENLLEKSLRKLQLWYMRNRRTKEVIRDGVIRFHPHDARDWILQAYQSRLRKYRELI